MSKKSRRRNKRILGALGALGALALMGRNKGTAAADVNSGRDGDSSSAVARAIANNKTPKSVTGTVFPGENKVTKTPQKVISRNTGVKMDASGKKVAADAGSKVPYINRTRDKQRNDILRAFRSNEAYQGLTPIEDPITEFDKSQDFGFGVMAKDGGRITKSGAKRGAAKRGFGRAYKKGKR